MPYTSFWNYTAPVTGIYVVTEKCEKLLYNDLLNGYLIAEFHKKTAELDYVLENNYGIAIDEDPPVCEGKITFYKSEDNKIYVNPVIEEV